MYTPKDIVALANAGFKYEQIKELFALSAQEDSAKEEKQPTDTDKNNVGTDTDNMVNTENQNNQFSDLYKKIDDLQALMQANAIMNTQQPKQESLDDILAKIIDP